MKRGSLNADSNQCRRPQGLKRKGRRTLRLFSVLLMSLAGTVFIPLEITGGRGERAEQVTVQEDFGGLAVLGYADLYLETGGAIFSEYHTIPEQEYQEDYEVQVPVSEQLYIDRIMAVYNEIGGHVVGHINSQNVYIIEEKDNWLRVNSELGYGWLDLNFEIPVWEIEEFMSQFGNTVSVHFENMATGFVFRHHAERAFFGASATKANFALYIYTKAERGGTDLNSVHAFTSGDYWHGSGFIRLRNNVGDTFTQRQLLHLMLSPSDNIATRILRRVHGLGGYREFIESIGGNPHFVQNISYSYLSADEAGLILREIYRFIMSGGVYSEEFKQNLLSNRYPFIISDHPVASKSGWADNYGGAWHDMAIVFAPSPYTLALLSNRDGNKADQRVYNSISMFFQEFNDRWFTVPEPSEPPLYTLSP